MEALKDEKLRQNIQENRYVIHTTTIILKFKSDPKKCAMFFVYDVII